MTTRPTEAPGESTRRIELSRILAGCPYCHYDEAGGQLVNHCEDCARKAVAIVFQHFNDLRFLSPNERSASSICFCCASLLREVESLHAENAELKQEKVAIDALLEQVAEKAESVHAKILKLRKLQAKPKTTPIERKVIRRSVCPKCLVDLVPAIDPMPMGNGWPKKCPHCGAGYDCPEIEPGG